MLTVLQLYLARQRGDLPAVAETADRLLAAVDMPDGPLLSLGEDLRALTLISLGIAEVWAFRFKDANQHLEQGVALAHRIARPYLELSALAHGAELAALRSYTRGAQRSRQAIDLARQHGWSDEPFVAVAYTVLGGAMVSQGRLAEGERWLGHAARTLRPDVEPAVGMHLHYARGGLEMARGRHAEAIAAFRAARQLAETLVTPHTLATPMRAHMLQALVLLGETGRVERSLAELNPGEREGGEMRNAIALLRLAQRDPLAATAALAPVLDGSVRVHLIWVVAAALLEAIARDELGDPVAAERAIEHALDLAEPDLVLFPFLTHPVPALLERHARDCAKHAALVAEILSLLPAGPGGLGGGEPSQDRAGLGGIRVSPPRPAEPPRLTEFPLLAEPLSQGETRVLRYLPTNLSAPEIARELSVSVNTVRTHIRHVCGKLGAHGRTEAVTQARALGLLAPSSQCALKAFWFRAPASTGPAYTDPNGRGLRSHAGVVRRSGSWAPPNDRTPLAGRAAHPGAGGVVSRTGLFERLGASARVTVVSAPPGSGKSVLLRSWIGEAGLMDSAGWVSVERDDRDPQRFWLSVLGALRQTSAGSRLVRELTAAPDLDGWAIVERLLKDLAPLQDRLWLVVDDVHELGSAEARRQLELLLMRGPPELRFVLATRHDLRLGLHRLRLEGELTEIRAAHLRFSLAEARELFAAAGVELPEAALGMLYERTEGWAAGLRLAALSLAGHPDPESGSRLSFPAANGPSPSTCWPRCWSGRARKYAGCCCEPRSWTRSMASSPIC